jgi:hypothetical protein
MEKLMAGETDSKAGYPIKGLIVFLGLALGLSPIGAAMIVVAVLEHDKILEALATVSCLGTGMVAAIMFAAIVGKIKLV